MRRLSVISTAAALAVGVAGLASFVRADDTKPPVCVPQKPIHQSFLDGLVGSWTTETTSVNEGKESKGTGKATFAMGVGGTALIETYEMAGPGPDGKPMSFHGHGVSRVSDDGKTLTMWWFDDMAPNGEPMKLSGPITDKDFSVSAETPQGKFTVGMQKTDSGVSLKLGQGTMEMRETYSRVKSPASIATTIPGGPARAGSPGIASFPGIG